jgi:hypothetical protein
VGCSEFAAALENSLGSRYFRIVNSNDLVVHFPPVKPYKHAGKKRYFDAQGRLCQKVASDNVAGHARRRRRTSMPSTSLNALKQHLIEEYDRLVENLVSPLVRNSLNSQEISLLMNLNLNHAPPSRLRRLLTRLSRSIV